MNGNDNVIYCTAYGPNGKLPYPPKVTTPGWAYLIMTDNPDNQVKGWDTVTLRSKCDCPEREAKLVKCLLPKIWPIYENSIYIDAEKYIIDRDLNELADISRESFAALKHRATNCVYTEIDRQAERDTPEALAAVKIMSRTGHVPPKAGLFDNSILIRHHDDKIIKMAEIWSEGIEVCKRDQCSLSRALIMANQRGQYLHLLNYKRYSDKRPLSNIYTEVIV